MKYLHRLVVRGLLVHAAEGSNDAALVERLHLDDAVDVDDLGVVDLRIGHHPHEEGPLVAQRLLGLDVQLLEDVLME